MTPVLSAVSKHERSVLFSLIPETDFTVHQWLEPYFSSGDVMFAVAPERYAVSCASMLVQEMYLQMVFNADTMWTMLERLQREYDAAEDSRAMYDKVVATFNDALPVRHLSAEDAARMLFLKLTSRSHTYPTTWNAFSEPPCPKSRRHVIQEQTFREIAEYLRGTRKYGTSVLSYGCSLTIVQSARRGDVVFADLRGKSVRVNEFSALCKLVKPLGKKMIYMIMILPDDEEFTPQKRYCTVHVKDGLRIVDNFAEVKKAVAEAEKERRKVVADKLRVLQDFGIRDPFSPEVLEKLYDVRATSDCQLDAIVRTRIGINL